ncbi:MULTISPECIES: hypothetical protein [unclassified Luteimonas]
MRGKIIHYNGSDGRGLIAADNRQLPFEIGHWRSDIAPTVNQVVDIALAGDDLESVARVPEDVLIKERAGQLASKLGSSGAAALQSIRDAAPTTGGNAASGWRQRLGIPLLAAYGVFAVSALGLPFISVSSPFGMGGRSYSLVGLGELSEALGASVGGAFWPWLAILSIALPVFWRSRFAWLALLLPLLATLKPAFDIIGAAGKASRAMGDAFGGDISSQMASQMADMIDTGFGAWACLLAALFVACVGLKRVLLPPAA